MKEVRKESTVKQIAVFQCYFCLFLLNSSFRIIWRLGFSGKTFPESLILIYRGFNLVVSVFKI